MRQDNDFINNDHLYLCEVQNLESPTVGRFVTNVNSERFAGKCGVRVELPGKAIKQLFDAAVEEPETENDGHGYLTLTGNMRRRSRFTVSIYADLTAKKELQTLSTPVDGVVIDPAKMSLVNKDTAHDKKISMLESATVVELRKMALDAGFTPNAIKYMKRVELIKLLM